MDHATTDTPELLERSLRGEAAARQELLVRHRGRLRRMVAMRWTSASRPCRSL